MYHCKCLLFNKGENWELFFHVHLWISKRPLVYLLGVESMEWLVGSIYYKEWCNSSILAISAGEGGYLEGSLRRERAEGSWAWTRAQKKPGQSVLLWTMHLLGLDPERTIIFHNFEPNLENLWFWFNKYSLLLCPPPPLEHPLLPFLS